MIAAERRYVKAQFTLVENSAFLDVKTICCRDRVVQWPFVVRV